MIVATGFYIWAFGFASGIAFCYYALKASSDQGYLRGYEDGKLFSRAVHLNGVDQ